MSRVDSRADSVDPIRAAIEASERAPSVLNTRPWQLRHHENGISLTTDADLRLDVADPAGRELVISCGAALFNIRAAMRAAGARPLVTLLPDRERPGLLADIQVGPALPPEAEDTELSNAIGVRHTHRGPFDAGLDDAALVRRLATAVAAEHAVLQLVTDTPMVIALAGLVSAAEHVQRRDADRVDEESRWVRPEGNPDRRGVHAEDFPAVDQTIGQLFPPRDYGHGQVHGLLDGNGTETGLVSMIVTRGDDRPSWLAAGQALERMLLVAAVNGVSAAFHTQPLEEPMLRNFIAQRFCRGEHPQMIMRLGHVSSRGDTTTSPPQSTVTDPPSAPRPR
ncbi:Acg family FMN-binding oxidoreductase [Spiractinospora alimapuensis]|uniref:Acg family FMN-binding oxidoreductase n=1 Tax=Spiractinospora alimapuensis TaxID=2820884 RepID=UPI001F25034C|nr:hypothetical protein [Spiractinospora alimapuensis]